MAVPMDAVEVIVMNGTTGTGGAGFRDWKRHAVFGAAWVGLLAWSVAAGGAPGQPPRPAASRAFDLAVTELDVRQLSSTPMFREVEVRCVVTNRGPKTSSGPAAIIISRPGDDGPKVLKKITLPDFAPGDLFTTRAAGTAWFATQVPYRCEIQYGGESGGDADPSDDFREMTYPKL